MLEFIVDAPIELPLYKGTLAADMLRAKPPRNWARAAGASGCYVYVVPRKRVPAERIPIYVGKATCGFEQECFTPDKLTKINRFLLDYRSTALSLILIRHPERRGRLNETAIAELERYLIRQAVSVNHALINKQGIEPEHWGIRGILRGGRGRTSQTASDFMVLMGQSVQCPTVVRQPTVSGPPSISVPPTAIPAESQGNAGTS